MISNHQKNIATFIHLSTFSRFIIPFGNFIGPILLWMTNKENSEFVDAHGKQAINFQISVLLYAVVLAALAIPLLLFNVLGPVNLFDFNGFDTMHFDFVNFTPLLLTVFVIAFLAMIGFILELVFIVVASLKARDGELYKYPLTINFLK
ncbi:DUF4870 domain-containing protein [Gelidibacter salicanalis]|uniref:DUF4870 domain-containing protein n=1 Tax=Gelidibacter salicanalis TaxID=291193 RepID=A0A934KRQ1_9FLAO|nr:DUF4870 domain-containing protein [Gelidibacter salicanalis]MBJ7880850.1 DUF4870 domain-containing protein [Gelidibacter salicanalis]